MARNLFKRVHNEIHTTEKHYEAKLVAKKAGKGKGHILDQTTKAY